MGLLPHRAKANWLFIIFCWPYSMEIILHPPDFKGMHYRFVGRLLYLFVARITLIESSLASSLRILYPCTHSQCQFLLLQRCKTHDLLDMEEDWSTHVGFLRLFLTCPQQWNKLDKNIAELTI